MPKAVVLLSGGLDSATVLAIALERGFECYALSFSYGQRHTIELRAASALARELGAREHRVVQVDLDWLGHSALTDRLIPVPKDVDSTGIPVTYVPARNTVFLSFAVAWAEVLPASVIFAGMNVIDYSGYPDCRPDFLTAFERAAREGTRPRSAEEQLKIRAPLIAMTKAQIVREGTRLGVPFEKTSSCYDPSDDLACGRCEACRLRAKGFLEADVPDPTRYA